MIRDTFAELGGQSAHLERGNSERPKVVAGRTAIARELVGKLGHHAVRVMVLERDGDEPVAEIGRHGGRCGSPMWAVLVADVARSYLVSVRQSERTREYERR